MREDQMVAAYEKGKSLRQIGRDAGMAHSFVWKVLHRHGVKFRPVGEPKGLHKGVAKVKRGRK